VIEEQARDTQVQRLADVVAGRPLLLHVMATCAATFTYWHLLGWYPQVGARRGHPPAAGLMALCWQHCTPCTHASHTAAPAPTTHHLSYCTSPSHAPGRSQVLGAAATAVDAGYLAVSHGGAGHFLAPTLDLDLGPGSASLLLSFELMCWWCRSPARWASPRPPPCWSPRPQVGGQADCRLCCHC
jgi:hypothetical protein